MFYSYEASLELLSKSLATMMCLLNWTKVTNLVSLSIDYMYLNNSGCAFFLSKSLKTSRPISHQQPIGF